MPEFMIRFFICNIFISTIIGVLLVIKRLCKNILSSRMQYNLGLVLLGLLVIPFLPLKPVPISSIFVWFQTFAFEDSDVATNEFILSTSTSAENWKNDFAISVSGQTSRGVGWIFFFIWIAGIFTMTALLVKSFYRLRALKKSALPLQNQEIFLLYRHCLKEMKITKWIPIYSTAFLKSPMITGMFKPTIYLPIHLISDYVDSGTMNEHSCTQKQLNPTTFSSNAESHSQKHDQQEKIRYMLLHELQHYKYKDTFINYIMNFALVLYWFNPLVWYAFEIMRIDREIACDTSVLEMLEASSYLDYGNTLIDFAQNVSRSPFPFASGISGNMYQMKLRILNIASYQTPSFRKQMRSTTTFILITALCVSFSPILSTYAANTNYYSWNSSNKNISYIDLSSYFRSYDGSFVLYDLKQDSWNIYNIERATMRVSPDSTYKIYDALFGLEEGIISPNNSILAWDGQTYPFEAWNKNHNLTTAMESSVNWYFQTIDSQLGANCIDRYLQKLNYGNEDVSGGLSTYWLESSLKISPLEQVELLTKFYCNQWGFKEENIKAVKEALHISTLGAFSEQQIFSSQIGNLYGKTGTGRVDGKDVNGWFVGFIEQEETTYFFAANISASDEAAGSLASEITFSILEDWSKLS